MSVFSFLSLSIGEGPFVLWLKNRYLKYCFKFLFTFLSVIFLGLSRFSLWINVWVCTLQLLLLPLCVTLAVYISFADLYLHLICIHFLAFSYCYLTLYFLNEFLELSNGSLSIICNISYRGFPLFADSFHLILVYSQRFCFWIYSICLKCFPASELVS